jgi:hypothetical protein
MPITAARFFVAAYGVDETFDVIASIWVRHDEERPAALTIQSVFPDPHVLLYAPWPGLDTSSTSESDPTSMTPILAWAGPAGYHRVRDD